MNKLLLAAPLALAVAAGTAQAQTLVATSNIVQPMITSSTRQTEGLATQGATARAPKPRALNHTRDAVTAPAANHHRPSRPCWLAILPSISTVSR